MSDFKTDVENNRLTQSQIVRRVTAITKKYIKEHNYNQIIFRYIRGTYHFDNCGIYFVTAKHILENATGLTFVGLNSSMARLK